VNHCRSAATATFDSNGFAAGGADPYLHAVQRHRPFRHLPSTPTTPGVLTGGDFLYVLPLAAGDYTVAMGVFAKHVVRRETWASGRSVTGSPPTGRAGRFYLGYYYLRTRRDASG